MCRCEADRETAFALLDAALRDGRPELPFDPALLAAVRAAWPQTGSATTRPLTWSTFLQPGDVNAAVGLWKDYVHQTERALWHDYEWGNVHWYCCENPLEARALLDAVMQALSPRSARELRKIVSRSDAGRNLPSPPYDADGR
ncbi:hypothetical protein ACIBVL_25705 [Streptomyces sp. NPDC049687]|uniref:hypothetical protein n=1 Tax=Streptomyces sp. NPDC049687 TaxID=3365596 RepID=UPI0037AAF527